MQKQKQVRKYIEGMGVDSLGIYIHNGITIITVHCNSVANKKAIRDILEFYLDSGEKILL